MSMKINSSLARRTASDTILRDKAFNIARNPKYGVYQRELAPMAYKFFDKDSTGSHVNTPADKSAFNNERPLDLATQKLAEELHKPIIRKLKKKTVYPGFKDNIWGADLADMQLITKFSKGFRLFCALLIFLVNMLGLFL